MRGNLKASPWAIIKAQHDSYVHAQSGRPRWRDWMLFDGVPIAVGAVCFWTSVRLGTDAAGALLTVSGILGALLFGAMLQAFERATDWSDSPPPQGRETTAHATFLREISANAGYASLVCICAAIAYVVALTTNNAGTIDRVASALGLALGAHLILILLMVMKRIFAVTEERLTRARTGADHNVVPHERRRAGGQR